MAPSAQDQANVFGGDWTRWTQPAVRPWNPAPAVPNVLAPQPQPPAPKTGIGGAGWNEDFDQAWANRVMGAGLGVSSIEDLRDPETRAWANRQLRKQQAAQAPASTPTAPQTGGPEPKPTESKPTSGGVGVPGQSIPGQTGPYGGYNPGGGSGGTDPWSTARAQAQALNQNTSGRSELYPQPGPARQGVQD